MSKGNLNHLVHFRDNVAGAHLDFLCHWLFAATKSRGLFVLVPDVRILL